jgi:glycosyltransferase involved in cell wall biosynthesis
MKKAKTIGIFTFAVTGMEPWDPESIRSGIMGSEEAVIYMSQELAYLGYEVLVFGHPPEDSCHSLIGSNPRYVNQDFALSEPLDIAMAWRWPQIGSVLKEKGIAAKAYLLPHDTIDNLEVPSEGFDGVLWLSEWQRKHWISSSPAYARFTEIFGNGIDEEQFDPVEERQNPYSCIYGSNYARGLEVLLQLWPEVKERFPKATLDVYYGWKHWGLLAPETETWMRHAITQLPDVYDHGKVGHFALNRAYAKASLWTYPCIRPETFCITALRAQLSGAVPVILEGSALSETVRHGYKCQRLEDYRPLLFQALEKEPSISLEERQKMGEFVQRDYTWKTLASK